MSCAVADIIVPVWNRPGETRESLAALVEHSGDARVILIDQGCDPETEQILHCFADLLDDRAILIRSGRSMRFVDALNRGLEMAEAPLAIAFRATSLVSPGWLEPFLAAALLPDAGILVPRLAPYGSAGRRATGPETLPIEVPHGSFAAMGITARLYRKIGGFDSSLDGGYWCLADYSRRAAAAGFRTLSVDGPPILYRDEVSYGSPERRRRILGESMAACAARWGEERAYCLCLSEESVRDAEALKRFFDVILQGARRGHRFFVFAPFRVYRSIVNAGLQRLHENISVERLSRCFPSRSLRTALSSLRRTVPNLVLLTGRECLTAPDSDAGLTAADLETVSPQWRY